MRSSTHKLTSPASLAFRIAVTVCFFATFYIRATCQYVGYDVGFTDYGLRLEGLWLDDYLLYGSIIALLLYGTWRERVPVRALIMQVIAVGAMFFDDPYSLIGWWYPGYPKNYIDNSSLMITEYTQPAFWAVRAIELGIIVACIIRCLVVRQRQYRGAHAA
ncbi:hypothetical protein K6V98_04915 [Collinsella sp. AGMB00827]|uniref:DUF2809 domain-containing protein n=1 Tax=Collinsella ureilytica TaxID=2869515 RepID=A0ABS7MK01_9ACTN|nr:hypothetical protein [Collinsella urealyticum]MBY4797696.1 hypothetical protein [Collinsella urealyticum]